MRPGGGRTKGHQWERDCAELLRPLFPGAKRGLGQARSAKEVADVEGTPWWVECKRGRRTNPHAALRQAMAATDGRPPLVIAKDDRSVACVTLLLTDFLVLARQAQLESKSAPVICG